MKEIPMLFSTAMVKAILCGNKLMSRRILNPQPIIDHDSGFVFDGKHKKQFELHNWQETFIDEFSRWSPGDILWVRETWGIHPPETRDGQPSIICGPDGLYVTHKKSGFKTPIIHKAGKEKYAWGMYGEPKWKPSIHMPKSGSRIWLEVTDVRVERLQSISPHDACEEGIEYWNIDADALEGGELQADFKNYTWTEKKEDDPNYEDRHFPTFASCIDSFRSLWQSINDPESWEANPWVWVVSFKVLSTTGKPVYDLENKEAK